jgi:hypothetical protein
MGPILGVIWHYWLAVAIFVPGILLIVAIVAGYLKKVVSPRYDPES